MLDTNILVFRQHIPIEALPDEPSVSSIVLAELAAGANWQGIGPAERAARIALLQLAESEFDPIPFGSAAARMYGAMCAAVFAAQRSPRGRLADLMIAAVAAAEQLPLYTTNPDDFRGLESLVSVVAVPRP